MRLRSVRDFGAFVRDRRRDLGLTQGQLATRAGVSQRWLAAVEAGKSTVQLGLVLRVLAVLDIELEVASPTAPPGVDLDDVMSEYDPRDRS